jgi:hypothetical protein
MAQPHFPVLERQLADLLGVSEPVRKGLSLGTAAYWHRFRIVFALKYLLRQTDANLYRQLFIARSESLKRARDLLELVPLARSFAESGPPIVKNDTSRMLPLYVGLLEVSKHQPEVQFQLIDVGCSYGLHALFDRTRFEFAIDGFTHFLATDNVASPFLTSRGRLIGMRQIGELEYSRFHYAGCDPFAPDAHNPEDIGWLEVNATLHNEEELDTFRSAVSAAAPVNGAVTRSPAHSFFANAPASDNTVVAFHSCAWHQFCGADRDAVRTFLKRESISKPAYEIGLVPFLPSKSFLYANCYRDGRRHSILRGVWHETASTVEILTRLSH